MSAFFKNLFLIAMVAVTFVAFGQSEDGTQTVTEEQIEKAVKGLDYSSDMYDDAPAPEQSMQPKNVQAEQYKKATRGLDYSDDQDKAKKPEKKEIPFEEKTNWNFDFSNLSQMLIIALILVVMIVGIYYVWKSPANKRVQGVYDISMDKLEEHLHETDLMRYLREALAQKDYAVAIRLYQLQTWKDLAAAGHIKWSMEKTNRIYLSELYKHPLHQKIRENTRTYETVWFGNTTLTEQLFRAIEPDFRAVLQQTGTSLNVNA